MIHHHPPPLCRDLMWENLLLHISVSGLPSADRLRHLHRLALGFDQFSLAILCFILLLHQLVGLQCPFFVISFLCLCPAGCFVGSINQLHVLMLASLSLQPPPSSPPAGASAIRLREHLRDLHVPGGRFRRLIFWILNCLDQQSASVAHSR